MGTQPILSNSLIGTLLLILLSPINGLVCLISSLHNHSEGSLNMLVFFEIRTVTPKGVLVIDRRIERSKRHALLSVYKHLYEAFYVASDQTIAGVILERPYNRAEGDYSIYNCEIEQWTYPNAPTFSNDCGGTTTVCIHEYGLLSQVTEGVFKL